MPSIFRTLLSINILTLAARETGHVISPDAFVLLMSNFSHTQVYHTSEVAQDLCL